MRRNKVLLILFVFTIIFSLVGCTVSIDDQVSQAKQQVKAAFNKKPLKANKETDQFTYHLPDNLKIEKEIQNNVILKEGNQTFILFVNPEENSNSKLMYETLSSKSKTFVLKTTFQGKDRFGYVAVKKIDDDVYETSVGIGGVKMTTDSKASDIAASAEEMMNIVSSVQYQSN